MMAVTTGSDTGVAGQQKPWYLQSKYPVLMPSHDALVLPRAEFGDFIAREIQEKRALEHEETVKVEEGDGSKGKTEEEETFTLVSDAQSTTAEIRDLLRETELNEGSEADEAAVAQTTTTSQHPFMEGLVSHDPQERQVPDPIVAEGRMLTENGGVAYRSTDSALVDLFYELEEVVSGPRLRELLDAAWASDRLLTLKIIFNARSIHLGKSSRLSFYRCAGWLAQCHPLTLVANLRWLSRPVIEKKMVAKEHGEGETDDDIVLVDESGEEAVGEEDGSSPDHFDVKHGVAHGYWKDLLNLLALAVNGDLRVLANPRDILNVENPNREPNQPDKAQSKVKRHEQRDRRHENAMSTFECDVVYRALYLSVTRLFTEQLKADLALLRGDDANAKKDISLCAKWAPSAHRFHDKHTFITSTIAETLYTEAEVVARGNLESQTASMDRETYLRYARELYRQDVGALRAHLDVLERHLSAKTLDQIKYDRVPSAAMHNNNKIFAKKDSERFVAYLDSVAEGKSRISGATLLPSTLIHEAMHPRRGKKGMSGIEERVLDGQWKTLVQRIKDSGALENSIAVCDVSGSMRGPMFEDGTTPMDSAIGLSLLLAEVTKGPFGGAFITFSRYPQVEEVAVDKTLHEKVGAMLMADWGMNTDFAAIFGRLILPMALKNKVRQEDMVKQIFVFSDMQFDEAESDGSVLSTAYENLQRKFAKAGYEMPRLVFWNLAGGRAGHTGNQTSGDPTAPKPVQAFQQNTAMVSGYSQGMLKMFLDNGAFEDPEQEEEEEENQEPGKEGQAEGPPKKKKQKQDPLSTVRKAVGHKAYEMLEVLD